MASIQHILIHTPWWAFILFLYLLKTGIEATKPRIIPIKKLFTFPIILLIMSLNTLSDFFPITATTLIIYHIALSIGILTGWSSVKKLELSFDHTHRLVKLPGSFTTLILMLSIFSAKYYFGYTRAIYPEVIQQIEFIFFQLILAGVCTGLFLGRLVCYVFRKNRAPHENLKETILS